MDGISTVVVIAIIFVMMLILAASLGWIGFDLTIPYKPMSRSPRELVMGQFSVMGKVIALRNVPKMGALLHALPNLRAAAYDPDDGEWMVAIAPLGPLNQFGLVNALRKVLTMTDEELDKLPDLPEGMVHVEIRGAGQSPAEPPAESPPELPPENSP